MSNIEHALLYLYQGRKKDSTLYPCGAVTIKNHPSNCTLWSPKLCGYTNETHVACVRDFGLAILDKKTLETVTTIFPEDLHVVRVRRCGVVEEGFLYVIGSLYSDFKPDHKNYLPLKILKSARAGEITRTHMTGTFQRVESAYSGSILYLVRLLFENPQKTFVIDQSGKMIEFQTYYLST